MPESTTQGGREGGLQLAVRPPVRRFDILHRELEKCPLTASA
jgi:hypothetical protein